MELKIRNNIKIILKVKNRNVFKQMNIKQNEL